MARTPAGRPLARMLVACALGVTLALLGGCAVEGSIVMDADETLTVDVTLWSERFDTGDGTTTPVSCDEFLPVDAGLTVELASLAPAEIGCRVRGRLTKAQRDAEGIRAYTSSVSVGRRGNTYWMWVPSVWASGPQGTHATSLTLTMPAPITAHGGGEVSGSSLHWGEQERGSSLWVESTLGEPTPNVWPWLALPALLAGGAVGAWWWRWRARRPNRPSPAAPDPVRVEEPPGTPEAPADDSLWGRP